MDNTDQLFAKKEIIINIYSKIETKQTRYAGETGIT